MYCECIDRKKHDIQAKINATIRHQNAWESFHATHNIYYKFQIFLIVNILLPYFITTYIFSTTVNSNENVQTLTERENVYVRTTQL